MGEYITGNYETEIKKWYSRAIKSKAVNRYSNTLYIQLNEKNDIFALQDFFLLCQKTENRRFSLDIHCPKKDPEKEKKDPEKEKKDPEKEKKDPEKEKKDLEKEEYQYRLKHYMFTVKELAKRIVINGQPYVNLSEVAFFRLLPLITVDKENYAFLSATISDIEEMTGEPFLVFKDENKVITKEQRILIRASLTCLFGEVENLTALTVARREYFDPRYGESQKFYSQIKDLPFLAFLIFAYYDRVSHEDIANKKKEELKKESGKSRWELMKKDCPEAFPEDDEISSEIFNAWDISDGLLQLLENIVKHAGAQGEGAGKGMLGLRIHANSEELNREYAQYFKGYENSYKNKFLEVRMEDGESEPEYVSHTEIERLIQAQTNLRKELNAGYFSDRKTLNEYAAVRNNIEQRRNSRKEIRHFLDVRISDISGKNMCQVFLDNLKARGYGAINDFKNITVRSFFDPDYEERKAFERYYKDSNIIYHYGLQIFASVIVNNDGYFMVRSCGKQKNGSHNYDSIYFTSEESPKVNFSELLDGTRYKILLPFSKRQAKTNIIVNSNISYDSTPAADYQLPEEQDPSVREWIDKLECNIFRMEEEELVKELADSLSWKEKQILVFDVSRISLIALETFCKALILFILKREKENRGNSIAVINCETYHFIKIIRTFAVCYNKNGESPWMRGTQIYLNGKDTMEEFLISGENVATLLERIEKLAFSRRIHPECIQILRKMLEKREMNSEYSAGIPEALSGSRDGGNEFKYVPFDLILIKDGMTLFEHNVTKVLEKDIQNRETGYKIIHTHTRIGSKIHIDAFYEAELLFYNNYYTNRFAYLLLRRLMEPGSKLDFNKPVCFAGYETYSEMLLCELDRLCGQHCNAGHSYAVCEVEKLEGSDSANNFRLRYKEKLTEEGTQVVLIVPINSTLTTFNKLEAKLRRECGFLNIVAYMGVVQIRDEKVAINPERFAARRKNLSCHSGSHTVINVKQPYRILRINDLRSYMEKKYWSGVDTRKREIRSKRLLGKDKVASYQVCARCRWSDPLKCCQCFPKDSLFEVPLVETNKVSVVPTQLIGLKEASPAAKIRGQSSYLAAPGQIESLRDYFYYDHIYRGENHFCYYIRTASYFLSQKENVTKWLCDVRNHIKASQEKEATSFDIIVNPMHFSSTAFVEAVNETVFGGASYVLRIEAEREFRDNIQTKYSDISALYENLRMAGKRVELNFHYVDDNIISGKTFHRVKHLISSLFVEEKDPPVAVNIFKDIIVLVNRLSNYSILNYVGRRRDYYAYLDLKISSLRTHKDACFLCKDKEDFRRLAEYSATNKVNEFWLNEENHARLKSLKEAKEHWGEKKQDRLFGRMQATHVLNAEMERLGTRKNTPVEVYKRIVDKIEGASKNQFEMLGNYLYVSAYPFLSYRKSGKEAVFHMTIILLEMLVEDQNVEKLLKRVKNAGTAKPWLQGELSQVISDSGPLYNIIHSISTVQRKKDFLRLLIKVSVELKSNYIIRGDRIKRILGFYYSMIRSENEGVSEAGLPELLEFRDYYVSQVKKLLSLNSDESKSTVIERNISGDILSGKATDKQSGLDAETFISLVTTCIYMENTRGLYDAIEDLGNRLSINDGRLREYYFDNYRKILSYNGTKEIDEQVKLSRDFAAVYESLSMTPELNARNDEYKRYIDFYNKLAVHIKTLIRAQAVYFLISSEEKTLTIGENGDVDYFDNHIRYDIFAHSDQSEYDMKYFPKEELSRLLKSLCMDTFGIGDRWAVVAYNRTEIRKEKEEKTLYFKPVYLLIDFKDLERGKKFRNLRRILVFRNKMIERLTNDFGNNVIQTWLEQSAIMKQLQKARAFMHNKDNNDYDTQNAWSVCKGFFYGLPADVKEHELKYGAYKNGYILELMTDIRIGRINLLLLANQRFLDEGEHNCKERLFSCMRGYIEQIRQAYYWEKVRICDKDGNPKTDERVIDEEIYSAPLQENRGRVFNRLEEYLIYLIYEVIHSAAKYGLEENGKKNIRIYREGIYLYVKNRTEKEKDHTNIYDGLARKNSGISLATICEYFLREYENRRVRILLEEDCFTIGLPLFKEEKQDD